MVQIIPQAPPKRTFGSILGTGLGQALRENSAQRMAKEASAAEEAQKMRLLEREYGLKGGLEKTKQAEKFAQQLNLMNRLGLNLNEEQDEEPSSISKLAEISAKQASGLEIPEEQEGFSTKNENIRNLIPDKQIQAMALVNPAVADKMQKHNDQVLEQRRHDEKIKLDIEKEKRSSEQHQKEFFHNESKKYDEVLKNQAETGRKKNRALEKQIQLAYKIGNWDRAVSALAGQSKWSDLLKSKTAQEFDSYSLPQLEGLRQILGGVLSDSDIRLIMQKVVTASKSPEANEKIAKFLMSENNYLIAKEQIGDEIKRNNGGYRPSDYESQINRIFNERYGEQIQNQYESLKDLPDDPKKLEIIGRRVVPPGTPLSQQAIKMYYEMANGDYELATRMAEEDGYDFPK